MSIRDSDGAVGGWVNRASFVCSTNSICVGKPVEAFRMKQYVRVVSGRPAVCEFRCRPARPEYPRPRTFSWGPDRFRPGSMKAMAGPGSHRRDPVEAPALAANMSRGVRLPGRRLVK